MYVTKIYPIELDFWQSFDDVWIKDQNIYSASKRYLKILHFDYLSFAEPRGRSQKSNFQFRQVGELFGSTLWIFKIF